MRCDGEDSVRSAVRRKGFRVSVVIFDEAIDHFLVWRSATERKTPRFEPALSEDGEEALDPPLKPEQASHQVCLFGQSQLETLCRAGHGVGSSKTAGRAARSANTLF
jgi:hypothetical protein